MYIYVCIYNEKNVCVYIYIYVGIVLINILVPRLGLPKQKFLALLLKTTHLKPKSKHHWPNPRIYNQSKTTFSKPSHCDLSLSLSLSLSLYHRDRTSRPLKIMPPPPPPPPTLAPKHEMKQTYIGDDEPEKHIDINLRENLCNSISFALASTLTLMYKLKFSFFVFWVWEIWKFCRSEQKVWFDNGWFLDIFWFLYFFFLD